MRRFLLAGLLGGGVSGCATYWQGHTAGTSGPIAWSIADATAVADRVAERSAYAFVLVLRETHGTPFTFTTLRYTVYHGTGGVEPGVAEQTLQGPWKLRARGTYRFPLTYTVTCPEGSGCIKAGGLAPTYHIVLTGTDNQGQPVRVVMDTKLPPDPSVLSTQ